MSPEQSSDWLPSGWTTRSKSNDYGKKIKFYVDPATGRKFYSKAQVVKYLEEAKSETIPEVAITSVDNAVNKVNESKANESLDWLPDGWIVEERTRISGTSAGSKFKFYVDPATGRKFYSKAQVVKYLEEAKSETIPELAITSVDNVVNKAYESLDWLPDGWIVEERTRNSGTSAGSKFKVYTDPKSGNKFYSKPEVSRYLAKISSSSIPQFGINAVNGVSSVTVEEPKQTNKETKQTHEEPKQTIEETKQTNESPEWLPQGWSVESKTGEHGKKRKVYTDPASGFKFYSKPQVSRYLEKINSSRQIVSGSNSSPQIVTNSANDVCPMQCLDETGSGPSFKPEVSLNHQTSKSKFDENLIDNGTFERVTDEKFPPGWVKEIRTRKTGEHKDQFYIDPVGGYMFRSKADALRYVETGDIRYCKCRPRKRDISDLNLMIENTPRNIDQSTGGINLSKPEVSEDHKTNQGDISGDPSVLKVSRINDMAGKNSSEEIPAGWKIEYKTRKMANRVVKDPYYLDPVSGYEFRSKPDVLRYLETGDINSCKIKPKKRDVNGLMSAQNISLSLHQPSSAVEVKKSGTSTKRQYPGESMDTTIVSKSAVSPEGRSQSRRRNESVATMDLSSPAGHLLEATPEKISESINKDSNGGVLNISSANDIILSVINDIFNDDEVLGSEHIIEETQSPTKSKKKRVVTPPLRSSKRLAGVNLDQSVKSSLGESSQAVAGNGEEIKANSLLHISTSSFEVPQQLQTPTNGEAADPTSIWKDNILSNELNGSGIKLVEQSVTENQSGNQVTEKPGDRSPPKELARNAFTGDEITSTVYQMDKGKEQKGDALESNLKRQEVEKKTDSRHELEQPPIEYPYMEDPCFEFAFKTLTGAIPVEENLSFQDYFKEQDTSQDQYNGQVRQLSETVQPSSFSTIEVASHSAAMETPVPLQQWPPNSTTNPASENISVPGFTKTSQQFVFGAGWQSKAK
ncbi:uncharacterized protein LOC141668052 isoform X1 [Apium graveolens]|uniref:uncharacterized protein LOC141668052 isoform X1 n=1 Tax=Apium graveolens TaxID=4045 RepID=UPI003D7B9E89